jgi:ssDNA-binding Zn-finger/Zn-ribbon topoisomerase 1
MTDIKRMEKPTDLVCEKCGKPMVIKWGRHGSFIACTGYPDCTNTRELPSTWPDVDKADLRAGRRGVLRELRASDGAQEGALRAVSTLVRDIRIARPPSSSARAEARRTCRWKKSARSAAITWC